MSGWNDHFNRFGWESNFRLNRVKRRAGREAGFTMLELLLVLSVVSILTLIILPLGNRWIQKTSEEDALKALVAEIQSLQSYSMAHGVYTKLDFRDLGRVYVSSAPGRDEFSRTTLPEGMNVPDWSYLKSVEFHPNGDIRNLGTLTILTETRKVQIKFQFQRGRMLIDG